MCEYMMDRTWVRKKERLDMAKKDRTWVRNNARPGMAKKDGTWVRIHKGQDSGANL